MRFSFELERPRLAIEHWFHNIAHHMHGEQLRCNCKREATWDDTGIVTFDVSLSDVTATRTHHPGQQSSLQYVWLYYQGINEIML